MVVIASVMTAWSVTVLNMTESAYSDLLSEFNEISKEHDILSGSYDRLVKEKDSLTKRHNELEERYQWIDPPLERKRIPSTTELELWLQNDETDEYEYIDPDFTCYQFTVLLMLHGRAQGYDIGVVAILGYRNETRESFSHSINAIMTTEGLVYIEPQLDEVWWLEDHSEIANGTIYTFPGTEDPIYVAEISTLFDFR